MSLSDKKFSSNKINYFWQPLLVLLFVCLILISLHDFASSKLLRIIGYTSLGSSSLIVFGSPYSVNSQARNILLAYFFSMTIGVAWKELYSYIENFSSLFASYDFHFFFSALGITVVMLLFIRFNVKHPPAAGLTLGIILLPWDHLVLLILVLGTLLLVSLHALLKKYLIDLF